MPTALEVKPVGQAEPTSPRLPLDTLSALGADRISAELHRALPVAEAAKVATVGFNSSI